LRVPLAAILPGDGKEFRLLAVAVRIRRHPGAYAAAFA